MKKFLIAGAALTAALVATAVPASAAPFGYGYGYERSAYVSSRDIDRQQANIAQRIAVGERNGSLSYREAVSLRADLRDIARLEARYQRGGFTRREVADLDHRLDALSQRVRSERHDYNDHRGFDGRRG